MKYGRFHEGVLIEIFTPPEGFSIEECFHASVAFELVPDDAMQGWVKNAAEIGRAHV